MLLHCPFFKVVHLFEINNLLTGPDLCQFYGMMEDWNNGALGFEMMG
jgi:hypothetical protein